MHACKGCCYFCVCLGGRGPYYKLRARVMSRYVSCVASRGVLSRPSVSFSPKKYVQTKFCFFFFYRTRPILGFQFFFCFCIRFLLLISVR